MVNYYADNYGTGELDSVYVDGEYENEGEYEEEEVVNYYGDNYGTGELDSAYV